MPIDERDDQVDREDREKTDDELNDEIKRILDDLPWDPTAEPGPNYPRL